jgi:hypothetical protein
VFGALSPTVGSVEIISARLVDPTGAPSLEDGSESAMLAILVGSCDAVVENRRVL